MAVREFKCRWGAWPCPTASARTSTLVISSSSQDLNVNTRRISTCHPLQLPSLVKRWWLLRQKLLVKKYPSCRPRSYLWSLPKLTKSLSKMTSHALAERMLATELEFAKTRSASVTSITLVRTVRKTWLTPALKLLSRSSSTEWPCCWASVPEPSSLTSITKTARSYSCEC